MNALWNSAFALLIVTGVLLGATPPLGKLASAAGVPPLLWSFTISFGAAAMLSGVLAMRGRWVRLDRHRLRYFIVAAAISYAIPNLLMFSAIPHLGAGYTGIMFTLSPVVTLVLSLLLRVRRPNPMGIAGIAVGFVGAALVAATRGEAGQPAEPIWVLAGLLIPVSLAAGNVYRTHDWPPGAGTVELAVGSHLASAAMMLTGMAAFGGSGAVVELIGIPWVVLLQIAASSAMFAFFFRLQVVGGPVYLSQIGYVGAAVGLLAGVVFLGERYGAATWIGAAIVAIGVAMTTRAQRA